VFANLGNIKAKQRGDTQATVRRGGDERC